MWASGPTGSVHELLKGLRPAWLAVGVLAATALLGSFGPSLPATLEGLRTAGPYASLLAAAALAWWFNRGRALIMAVSMLGAFAALHWWRNVYLHPYLAMLVCVNVLAVMLRLERGARFRGSWVWLAVLVVEGLSVTWHAEALPRLFLADTSPTPITVRVTFAAACAAALWRAWPEFTPVQVGNAAALVAFYIAAGWVNESGVYALFMSAAGVLLAIALIQESHHLAFRDQLTGLPARRALEERMRSLGERYAIGMVDVDHFKKFNDTHGHDVGDQVLKLVAGRLAQVGGGGIAYRYGGEEFSVLFPGSSIREAERALEATRASIENYRMAIRGADRPRKSDEGAKQRGAGAPEQVLSVTVSVGVAAPSRDHATTASVLKAADEALYRAKQGGRNRVSR